MKLKFILLCMAGLAAATSYAQQATQPNVLRVDADDLGIDPQQSTNVIREYPEKAAELAKRFTEIRKR